MTDDYFKLKYRKKNSQLLLLIAITLLFGIVTLMLSFDENPIAILILSLFCLVMLSTVIVYLKAIKKDYHFLLDRKSKELVVDYVIRKARILDLNQVYGVSYTTRSSKYRTSHFLQFKVTPGAWADFYRVSDKKFECMESDYDFMVITLNVMYQTDEEIITLMGSLNDCGIHTINYYDTKYGVLKASSINNKSPAFRKEKLKQGVSYFFNSFITAVILVYFLIEFLGPIYGIFW